MRNRRQSSNANTNNYKKKIIQRFTKKMQIKLLAIFAFVLLCLIFILIRIVYLNVHSGKSYAKQVLSQKNYDSQTLYSRRGEIQDANGRLLAYSEKMYDVVLDCNEINRLEDENNDDDYSFIEETAKAVAEVFDLDRAEIRDRITDEKTCDSQYQVVARLVTEEQKDAYEAYKSQNQYADLSAKERETLLKPLRFVAGVWFEEKYVRRYPMGRLASNVIGFSNDAGDGICGLESYYDSMLKGTNGRLFGYLNENQEFEKKTIPPDNGYILKTTLDMNIQEIVQKYIDEFDELFGDDHDDGTAKHGAKNIGVIVMKPDDGSILAMATNSEFDLNNPQDLTDWYTETEIKTMGDAEYVEALTELWKNFCVTDGIEPGSTFKPITIASALECGAITPEDGYYCDGGEIINVTEIHCDVYPDAHGSETLEDALRNSCNDALMAIGMKMGVSRFVQYQSLFNFGKLTGIDLPNEAAGYVFTEDTMNEVELATCTFGQGLTCTMIQEAAAFCATINGGYYYQPHIVDKVLHEDGNIVKSSTDLLLKQPISSDVSELVCSYLESVVKNGTGADAQVPGYRVGGKTGTAEKMDLDNKTRAKGKYLVSFIGVAPVYDPQVVVYVVVDEPNVPDQAHSTFAQGIFREICVELLPYMGIYPTEEVTQELLDSLGLTFDDIDLEETVTTFPAFDCYGNYYNDARVKDGVVVTAEGAAVEGAKIDSEGIVYDAYENQVSRVILKDENEKKPDIDPTADNPNIALPPIDNAANNDPATVWDGTALEEEN